MLIPGKYRDVIFLDLALEGAHRRLVESSLGDLNSREANLEQLVDVASMCLENACLSTGSKHRPRALPEGFPGKRLLMLLKPESRAPVCLLLYKACRLLSWQRARWH